MDVVINSQIQSPLVRTLATTKGKAQSFTHNIADNVPPCSFSKIVLSAQQQGETQYGRNYKIKVPQYGYLRDVILKFTTEEAPIPAEVVAVTQPLYKFHYTALEDIRAAGSYMGATKPGATGADDLLYGGITVGSRQRASDLTWYNLQTLVAATGASSGYSPVILDTGSISSIKDVLAPQFDQLIAGLGAGYTVVTGTNGYSSAGGTDIIGSGAGVVATGWNNLGGGNTNAGPYTQLLKLNGSPAMWSAHLRFYYGIYKLARETTTSSGGVTVPTHPLAKMVWEQLLLEPQQVQMMPMYNPVTAQNIQPVASSTGNVITSEVGNAETISVSNVLFYVRTTLPKTVVGITRGGENFWIPKLPQFRFDSNGTIVGVDFVPLHFLHPNDNGDTLDDITLLSKYSSTNGAINYRVFPYGDTGIKDDYNMWDWQSESYYYNGFAANIAERLHLSSHNRPIQTVFPQESLTRVQKFQPAERQRYLKMMKPRILKSGAATGDTTGNGGQRVTYFPFFLSSTEDPSRNYDTRFVEQLDIDVITNPLTSIFVPSDVVNQSLTLQTLAAWIDSYRVAVFDFNWSDVISGNTFIGPGPFTSPALPDAVATSRSVYSTPAALAVRADLGTVGALTDKPDSFRIYQAQTPRSLVLTLRSFKPVPQNKIIVEAIAYFHNFHDATAQAIRDSNFKPGTPASLLTYNTYMESVRPLTLTELQETKTIQVPLTTNNLVFGTTFFVRRRTGSPLISNKRDHLMQTLPIKEVTLTGSGQQIYNAILDESQVTDVFDYPLASGKQGRMYSNALISQSLDDPITGESFYFGYIPFSFSSDMTYNSGSVAFQTINNPVLTITVDVGKNASRPFDITGSATDAEWELVIYHNYWQMVRIDSNTGAITRSLDL